MFARGERRRAVMKANTRELRNNPCIHSNYITPKLSFVIICTLNRMGWLPSIFQESFTIKHKKVLCSS